MKQKDINVEKRFLSKESRFSAKGQVGLPAGMDDIGRVVDICAAAEVTDTEITDGKLEARGVVRLCITYISRDGAVCGFASETLFSDAGEQCGAFGGYGKAGKRKVRKHLLPGLGQRYDRS